MQLNPTRLHGSWNDGFALDMHILRSDFLGYDEHGHPQFHTVRTELGELLFRLKYRSDRSANAPIGQAVSDFVRSRNVAVDVIVPVPPNRSRAVQPLFEIADEVGRRLNVTVDKQSVRKVKETAELKNVDYAKRLESLEGAHSVEGDLLRGRSILLLDDLYQSGATLNAVARMLRHTGGASAVFVLALTRARG